MIGARAGAIAGYEAALQAGIDMGLVDDDYESFEKNEAYAAGHAKYGGLSSTDAAASMRSEAKAKRRRIAMQETQKAKRRRTEEENNNRRLLALQPPPPPGEDLVLEVADEEIEKTAELLSYTAGQYNLVIGGQAAESVAKRAGVSGDLCRSIADPALVKSLDASDRHVWARAIEFLNLAGRCAGEPVH